MNEEILKEAIKSGITNDTVISTIESVINKSDELGKTPKQIENVVVTIASMKKNVNSIPDKKYASTLVKENHDRIKKALEEGISPNEIATTLMKATEKANNRRNKSRLRFITKLIIKMKQKELIKDKKNQIGIQKILVK